MRRANHGVIVYRRNIGNLSAEYRQNNKDEGCFHRSSKEISALSGIASGLVALPIPSPPLNRLPIWSFSNGWKIWMMSAPRKRKRPTAHFNRSSTFPLVNAISGVTLDGCRGICEDLHLPNDRLRRRHGNLIAASVGSDLLPTGKFVPQLLFFAYHAVFGIIPTQLYNFVISSNNHCSQIHEMCTTFEGFSSSGRLIV